ncbi:MAG: methanol--corrinoid methyltransferase [Spirochaetes bacterium]|nr:methanol--corrinoid methyltransferase [Spirochaetota bacterium]
MKYTTLAISDPKKLLFGHALHPVRSRRGLLIGGGKVYPELNFTLPPMEITDHTFPEIRNQYRNIVQDALERAVDLHMEGLVLEFETLLEMTLRPEWGTELVAVMNEVCEHFYQTYGLKTEIRLTPNDTRDFQRPVRMRTSRYLESMFQLFEAGAKAGGTFLSIESTGGKEVCDEALVNCDTAGVVFALAVLGVRDMHFLWKHIVDIAHRTGTIPGGDTACGFGNTAMVLAEKKYIPKVFAAMVRIVSVVRTLVAIEEGALGPDKDCGYEGPFLKAITGLPISMEGKTAACAHFSPVGNVAAAAADLWSNESVANTKLLAGMAPTVYLEQLEYDTRLMNRALDMGYAGIFQQLLIESDIHLDPQALILAPESAIAISKEIVQGKNPVEAAIRGAQKGMQIIEETFKRGDLRLEDREVDWLFRIQDELAELPTEEEALVARMEPLLDPEKVILSEYGL